MPDEERYNAWVLEFGPALRRLVAAYEADPALRQDLEQDIHVALWRSTETFHNSCSLRTWVYRIAHNTAASHVMRRTREKTWITLDATADLPAEGNHERVVIERLVVLQLMQWIQELQPLDKQVILLYLEGLDAHAIAEVTSLSRTNVTTKIHHIKRILARRFQQTGGTHAIPTRSRRPPGMAAITGDDGAFDHQSSRTSVA